MQRIKPSVVLAAAAVVGIAVYASAYVDQTGRRMAVAAKRFLDSLPQGKAEKATFRFDDPERLNWHFIPRDRLGLPIVESYSSDMPDEVCKAWHDEIRQAGPERIKFSWTGPADRTQPHAYRVQGPTFLIEFNNTQNGANHIHSIWRNMLGDFGIPLASK